MRTVVVPSPCTSEFSMRVASACAWAPGTAQTSSPRVPVRRSLRPAASNAGDHSVIWPNTSSSTETALGVGDLPAVEPHHLVDHAREPLHLAERRGGLGVDLVEVVGGEDLLQPQRQAGERGAQLVRRLGRRAPLALEQLVEAVRAAVEDVGDGVELGYAVPLRHRPAVTGGDALGGDGEVLERRVSRRA